MMHRSQQRGFTLVETLVAITILTVALTGPLYAVQRSLIAADVGRDELTASSLAQEGIEYVRSIRDGNYLYNVKNGGSRDWLYGLNACTSSSGCTVDATPTGNGAAACSTTCAPLKLSNTSSGNPYFYNQQSQSSSNKNTIFTRTVKITELIPGQEAKVIVVVSWTNNNKAYNVTVSDILENWL